MLNFLQFQDHTENALVEVKTIMSEVDGLNHSLVRQWTSKHKEIFESDLMHFSLKYLDSSLPDIDGNLYIPIIQKVIEKEPFLSLIIFSDCMWVLYFGEYYLAKEDRQPPDPIGSYYSKELDPNEPSDFEKILSYLRNS